MPFDPDPRTLGLLAVVLTVALVAAGVTTSRALRGSGEAADPSAARLGDHALRLVAATWFLLVFGSSVRVNGAGLACPDWPACFGQVIPQLDWEVSLEFGHRVYAGGISLAFFALGALVLRRRELRPAMLPLFGLAAVALAVQVVLGGLTVLHLLAEWTVASHLLVGNTFCLLLALVALRLRDIGRPVERAPVPGGLRAAAVMLAAAVAVQLGLGGFVSSSHAGLACGTWPGCNGDVWFPTFTGSIGLQVTHRIAAYAITGIALVLVGVSRGRGRAGSAALAVLALVLGQVALGVANVLLHLPVEVTLLHSAGAAAIVLATTWLNYEAWAAPLAATERATSFVDRIVEAK